MRYVEAKLTKETHALIYRIYVTDTLQSIANEISVFFSKNGKEVIKKRFYDFCMDATNPQPQETRTKEEVVNYLKDKMAKMKGQS